MLPRLTLSHRHERPHLSVHIAIAAEIACGGRSTGDCMRRALRMTAGDTLLGMHLWHVI